MNKKTPASQNTMAWVGRRAPGSRNAYAKSENSKEGSWQKLISYTNAPWAPLPYGNRMAETSPDQANAPRTSIHYLARFSHLPAPSSISVNFFDEASARSTVETLRA